jgi:hypothetical protein
MRARCQEKGGRRGEEAHGWHCFQAETLWPDRKGIHERWRQGDRDGARIGLSEYQGIHPLDEKSAMTYNIQDRDSFGTSHCGKGTRIRNNGIERPIAWYTGKMKREVFF